MSLLAHPPILETHHLTWPDEAACAAHATRLAALPALRDAFITLQGPLGAGKTTWVRHLLRALGVAGRIKSPTYAVMESYEVKGWPISHFDFYRFTDAREAEDAGFREVFGKGGLKLAEWATHAAGALPLEDLHMHIEPGASEDERRVTLHAHTERGLALLHAA